MVVSRIQDVHDFYHLYSRGILTYNGVNLNINRHKYIKYTSLNKVNNITKYIFGRMNMRSFKTLQKLIFQTHW